MFQPQRIVCPYCHHSDQIITEDIRESDINVRNRTTNQITELDAQVECPCCHQPFTLLFVLQNEVGGNSLYVCNCRPNIGLQMWKRIDGDHIITPKYDPNNATRVTPLAELDAKNAHIADLMFSWKSTGQPCQDLDTILGQVEDYTKKKSWKKFNKKHFVVVTCAPQCDINNQYVGFNGAFSPVKKKNFNLMNGIQQQLGRKVEEKSNRFCYNKIGHCAEVHAANSCLNNTQVNIHDLRFSLAYICRTGLPRSYCMNCITLFGLTNV